MCTVVSLTVFCSDFERDGANTYLGAEAFDIVEGRSKDGEAPLFAIEACLCVNRTCAHLNVTEGIVMYFGRMKYYNAMPNRRVIRWE